MTGKHLGIARGRGRNTWNLNQRGEAALRCPACGREIELPSYAFEIDEAGRVEPEVVCGDGDCTFAEWMWLVAWGWEEDVL